MSSRSGSKTQVRNNIFKNRSDKSKNSEDDFDSLQRRQYVPQNKMK